MWHTRALSALVLGRTLKYRTSNLPNLQKSNLEPTEPPICFWKPNLEPTEPPKNRTEPRTLLNRMRKNWWFFEFFLSKPNLEPTEPLVGPQKPNLEPTEPQKTERTSEPNQVRPNTRKNNEKRKKKKKMTKTKPMIFLHHFPFYCWIAYTTDNTLLISIIYSPIPDPNPNE